MWSQDDFPGVGAVPWQLIIRARYVDEIDAIVAHTVVRTLGPLLSRDRARELAGVAAKATAVDGSQRVELSTDQRMAALTAFDDWDDGICPRWWPFPWPPRPHGLEDFDDPAILIAVNAGRALVSSAASEQLGRALEGTVLGG